MNESTSPQKCEASRVVDGENWEDFYWPGKKSEDYILPILEMREEKNSKYLAILFFNQNYKRQQELPGVGRDKEKLMELMGNYVQESVDDSDDILECLQVIVDERIGEEYERVHFHFSGKICDLKRIQFTYRDIY